MTMPTRTLPLREALNDSISSGRFTDTKIILYSRRSTSGTVSKPKALYANSHVLKSVAYFNDRGFYLSISRWQCKLAHLLEVLSGEYAESEQKDFSEPIDENEPAENYGYCSDSDLENDEDIVNTAGKPLKKATLLKSSPIEPLPPPTNDKKSPLIYGEWDDSSSKGMVIKIRDVAFITYASSNIYRHHTPNDFVDFRPS